VRVLEQVGGLLAGEGVRVLGLGGGFAHGGNEGTCPHGGGLQGKETSLCSETFQFRDEVGFGIGISRPLLNGAIF